LGKSVCRVVYENVVTDVDSTMVRVSAIDLRQKHVANFEVHRRLRLAEVDVPTFQAMLSEDITPPEVQLGNREIGDVDAPLHPPPVPIELKAMEHIPDE
jgi:hypothetical protein